MNIVSASRRSSRHRITVTGATLGLLTAAFATFPPASAAPSAAAATELTPYAFSGSSYASEVTGNLLGATSGKTSLSSVSCTKLSGVANTNYLATTNTGTPVTIQGARTTNSTWKQASGTIGMTSMGTVAKATLGSNLLGVTLTGVTGQSIASAGTTGTMSTRSTFDIADVSLSGSGVPTLSSSLRSLINGPTSVLVDQLKRNGSLTIPGLGVIRVGAPSSKVTATSATTTTSALLIQLYGPNLQPGGGDDTTVTLDTTQASIMNNAPQGVFMGSYTQGVRASVLKGTGVLGPQLNTVMPCPGTAGKPMVSSLAALDQPALGLSISTVRNTLTGTQDTPTGGLTSQTESSIARIALGGLRIDGIRASAKAVRSASGTITRSTEQAIAEVSFNGTTLAAPKVGLPLTIPGIAKIEVPAPVNTATGVQATGLRITLLSGTAAESVATFATAQAQGS